MPLSSRRLASMNGWYRAWVLAALVGFFGVAVCGFYSFPTLARQESKVHEVSSRMSTSASSDHEAAMRSCFKLLSSNLANTFPTCSRLATESELFRQKNAHDYQERAIAELQSKYLREQTLWLGKVVGTWAGALAALYLLGFGVGWVRRGFQRDA